MTETVQKRTLEDTLGQFMAVTAKSTVAVIIPLYGYWADIPDNPLIKEKILSVVLSRIYSNVHQLYLIFVANPQSLPNEGADPQSITNIILAKSQGGNVKTIPVKRNASYPEYIEAGMDCAINETNAQFMMVFNPWVMIQENAVDVLVDRANRGDDAKVISGYDFRDLVAPEEFDQAKITTPKENWDFSFDFVAMPRFMAEMIRFDTNYQTHQFMEKDIWQQVFSMGFGVISSQRIPVFPFDFPWTSYESKEQFDVDKTYFNQKWHFDPGLKYKNA